MATLPKDTKQLVTESLARIAERHLADQLDGVLDFGTIEIHRVDRLLFNLRITPNGGGQPKYITVKVSESW